MNLQAPWWRDQGRRKEKLAEKQFTNKLFFIRPLMPRDNGLDGSYVRREKQKKEKSVKVAKINEKVAM